MKEARCRGEYIYIYIYIYIVHAGAVLAHLLEILKSESTQMYDFKHFPLYFGRKRNRLRDWERDSVIGILASKHHRTFEHGSFFIVRNNKTVFF